MTKPPGMTPVEFRAHLDETLAPLRLSPPSVATMQQRIRRRRHRYAATVAGVVATIAAGGIAVPLAVAGGKPGQPDARLGGPPATVSPVPTIGPTLSPRQQILRDYPNRCGGHYDRWHLIQALTASVPGGAVIQVTGYAGFTRCGGPSDIAYLHHQTVIDLTLAPRAVVRVVDLNRPSHTRPLDPTKLRAYVRGQSESDFFRYVGSKNAITTLVELYHP